MNNQDFDKRNFTTIPIQRKVEKPWGYEIIYVSDDAPFTGKILFVKAGSRLSLQYHDEKEESLCLFSGKAIISLDDENGQSKEIEMEEKHGYQIKPGQKHRVTAIEDSFVIESSLPETGNTFRVEDDFTRPTETEELRKLRNRGWNPQKGGGVKK